MAELFDDQQRLVVLDRLAVFDQDAGDGSRAVGIDLVERIASMMQTGSPTLICWPISTNGLEPGEAER